METESNIQIAEITADNDLKTVETFQKTERTATREKAILDHRIEIMTDIEICGIFQNTEINTISIIKEELTTQRRNEHE